MKKYNIVWAIVDSVRKYHSDDDRSRLKFMDEFSNESIEFKNVVTSAPSTVMSISAMMTSLPAYYIGRNYSDFRFDNNFFTTLSSILKIHNYDIRALIMHKEIREKLRVFDLINKKYWPKNFSHKSWWNNSMILELLKNSIKIDKAKYTQPIFWFLDFNCRKDPKTSSIVKESFEFLKKNGFNDDNTIFILCSDHGYPDPRRGITPEQLKIKKLTHDIFMTDDNITIPLFLKYPGCEAGKVFSNTISTLDIMPTILDILEIKVDQNLKNKWKGISLLNFINKKEKYPSRFIRTDARFLGQEGRVTAIRNDKYKYVIHHDENKEEFFDISNFQLHEKKISKTNNRHFIQFKKEFNIQEDEALGFQIHYSIYKLKEELKKYKIKKTDSILIMHKYSGTLKNNIHSSFSSAFISNRLDFLDLTNTKQINFKNFLDKYFLFISFEDSVNNLNQDMFDKINRYIKFDKKIVLDINMNISARKGEIRRYLRTLYINKDFYIQEPTLVFFELFRILKIIKNRLFF